MSIVKNTNVSSIEQSRLRTSGLFLVKKERYEAAMLHFDQLLDTHSEDAIALHFRSICKRAAANIESALMDSRAATKLRSLNLKLQMELCRGLYELNEFERCKTKLLNSSRLYTGAKKQFFLDYIDVVDGNLNDSLGYALHPFILKNGNVMSKAHEEYLSKQKFDNRPMWKILRSENQCDVQSVLKLQEELLEPREIARRALFRTIFYQCYFQKSWHDIFFLEQLSNSNSTLLLPYAWNKPQLADLVRRSSTIVHKFVKMLHARDPFYNRYLNMCPDRQRCRNENKKFLFRVQRQTRRGMLAILATCKRLRAEGKVKELAHYIEEMMGDYIVLKTNRLMPWKFEFINDVYNHLALAYADEFVIPDDLMKIKVDRKLALLRLPYKAIEAPSSFVFGDRSTHAPFEEKSPAKSAFFTYQQRLKNRLFFAKYSIERSYLLHEIARSYLHNGSYKECLMSANKAVVEIAHNNNFLWQFLSVMLVVKAFSMMRRVERVKQAIDQAYKIALRLNNNRILGYVKLLDDLNEYEIAMKKRTLHVGRIHKRKNRSSTTSTAVSSTSMDASFFSSTEYH